MVWPEPTRMRTTRFTQVTTMQVTGATVDSCFVLVRTHQHSITFQSQAKKLQGRVQKTGLRINSHRMHMGAWLVYAKHTSGNACGEGIQKRT